MVCSVGYFEKNIRSFLTEMRQKENDLLSSVSTIVERFVSQLAISHPICVVTTGSDGRFEKGATKTSPLELAFIIGEKSPTTQHNQGEASSKTFTEDFRASIIQQIRTLLDQANKESSLFDPVFTVRFTQDNPLVDDAEEGKIRITPTRALDAAVVYGDPGVMEEFKEHTLKALQSMSEKEIVQCKQKFFVKARREFRRCYSKQNAEPVNIQDGILSYSIKNPMKSTKFALLRPVQYKLLNFIISAAQTGKLTPELYKEMPPQIYHRILWMQEKGFLPLSLEEAKDLGFAYLQALQWHILSQKEFELENSEVYVDAGELRDVVESIKSFIEIKDPLFS